MARFIAIGFQLRFRISHRVGASKPGETESEWICCGVHLLRETHICTRKKERKQKERNKEREKEQNFCMCQ